MFGPHVRPVVVGLHGDADVVDEEEEVAVEDCVGEEIVGSRGGEGLVVVLHCFFEGGATRVCEVEGGDGADCVVERWEAGCFCFEDGEGGGFFLGLDEAGEDVLSEMAD